jgi:DNA-binding transcriptional regulator YhcF (GntR family)
MTVDRSSPLPLHSQIEQLLERLIFEQRLAAHEVLPSVAALSEHMKVSPLTVQKAYRHLQERGLIYSIAGKGTFVSQMKDRPFAAIVVHNQLLMEAALQPAFPMIIQAVRDELIARGHRPHLLIDANERRLSPAPISPEVMDLLRRGRVNGIVMMWHHGSEELFQLAKDRDIPLVGYGVSTPQMAARVNTDSDEMLNRSMAHLKSRGVKKVGVMWLDRVHNPLPLRAAWVSHLQKMIHSHGLEGQLDWLLGVPELSEWSGYHVFNHLWELSDRPQGLVILEEIFGRGVLMATRSSQIRVPQEMELVVASYEDSPIEFPHSWSRSEANLRQCGEMTASVLCELMEGRAVAGDVQFPFTWHSGLEGADDSVTAAFRDGRQILAKAADALLRPDRPARESAIEIPGMEGDLSSSKQFRPVFGRTIPKESVR